MCWACGVAEETLIHVLNHCQSVMPAITERHNSIMREVLGHVPEPWRPGVDVDRTVSHHVEAGGANLRPDIVLTRPDGVSVVVDVTCPFESGADFLGEGRRA